MTHSNWNRRQVIGAAGASVAVATLGLPLSGCSKEQEALASVPSYLANFADIYAESPHDAALEWFKAAEFGMFIHYGLYSMLGGEWQGVTTRVAGTPEYRPGERVLVFLRRDEHGRYRTYGMAQGKFTIHAAIDGPTVAVRDLGDIAFARWSGNAMQVDHSDASTMAFDELRYRIENVLEVRP